MGWSFFYDTNFKKKELVAYLLSQARLGPQLQVIKHAVVGNHLWTVIERTKEGEEPVRFIGLDLMAPGGKDMGWGYKDLCENMGPAELDCPTSFFELAPEPESQFAKGWRDEVRVFHLRKRLGGKMARPGAVITLGGEQYRLDSDLGRKGWLVTRVGDGAKFRATARQVSLAARQLVNVIDIPEAPEGAEGAMAPQQMTLAA